LNTTPADYQFSPTSKQAYAHDHSYTQRLETERRYLRERHDTVLREVLALEVQMGLGERWTPTSTQYKDTLRYISMRKYHRALDELQRLVVMRLFELHKLNLNQTGNRHTILFFILTSTNL
jgi:hypothetical protein